MTANRTFYAFDHSLDVARATAERFGASVERVDVHAFPDGESLVRLVATRGGPAYVFCSLDRPNEKIFELLLAADALRRQAVSEIVLVAPYLGYMRQDRVFHTGEPISQRVFAGLLDTAFDGVLTIEPHLHRIADLSEIFSRARARSVSAARPIAEWLREVDPDAILVGPDAESAPWIGSIAERSGSKSIVASKQRLGDRSVRIELPSIPDGTTSAWIVDDIASSGTTLLAATEALHARGIERVGAIVAHALFDADTLARLEAARLDALVSTDSIPHATNRIPVAPLLAEMIEADEAEREAA